MKQILPLVALVAVSASCSSGSRRANSAATTTSQPATTTTTTVAAGAAPHVMVIVLENREFDDVVGRPASPFFTELAGRAGLATHVFARTHPSLPNYLGLIAGTTFGIQSDCTSCSVDGEVLTDQLDRRGVPWAAFMEDMPSPCFTGASAGRYAKKHNPFVYVRHLVADPAACARVQPHDRLAAALDAPDPPAFVWVTPDLCHDGHDCSLSTTGDWLRGELATVQASPWYAAGGIVIVTWDEGVSNAGCCGPAAGGRIATFVLAEGSAGRRLDTPVSQAGILGTIEDLYGVPRLAEAADPASGSMAPLLPNH